MRKAIIEVLMAATLVLAAGAVHADARCWIDPYGHRRCVYDPNYYNPDLDRRRALGDEKSEAEWARMQAIDELRSKANEGDRNAQLILDLIKKD